MISGFCHGVNEICAVLGFYTVWNGSFCWCFGTAYGPHLQGSSSPGRSNCL